MDGPEFAVYTDDDDIKQARMMTQPTVADLKLLMAQKKWPLCPDQFYEQVTCLISAATL